MTRNLHQFSFTQYDDQQWDALKVGEHIFPSYLERDFFGEDPTLHAVMRDDNFIDVPVNDHVLTKLQQCYDEFAKRYNEQTDGFVELTVVPNHYGCIFVDISSVGKEEIVNFIQFWDACNASQNICYHEWMPEVYEDIFISYSILAEEDASEEYEDACTFLGFDADE